MYNDIDKLSDQQYTNDNINNVVTSNNTQKHINILRNVSKKSFQFFILLYLLIGY